MAGEPRVLLLGTLDTKGAEIAFIADAIARFGGTAIVLDMGVLGEPQGLRPDITREEVARAGGHELRVIQTAPSRRAALEAMQAGLCVICERLAAARAIDGVLCIGGAQGAQMGAVALQRLPIGLPKLIVSPLASGMRPFDPIVGRSDMTVMHSVVDLLGLNPLSRAVFQNAAGAIVGMARARTEPVSALGPRSVAITMLGQTTPGVMAMLPLLEAAGWQPVVFHASGIGGPTMEQFLTASGAGGVIDFTLDELSNLLMDGLNQALAPRLVAGPASGLPQVVVPGAADFFNQGAPETIPPRFRGRPAYLHNSTATLVRLTADEMRELGALVAGRLATSRGPTALVVPLRGLSAAGAAGQPLHDPAADAAFADAAEAALPPSITVERVDANVNDPRFAQAVVERFLALAGEA